MKDEQRNEGMDAAKGIAIFLVVWGHLLTGTQEALGVLINSCHMPAFFFVSGFFASGSCERYSAQEYLRKKAGSLLVPYLVWSLVALIANGLPLLVKGDLVGFITEFTDVFLYARSVWFFPVLFLTELCFYMVRKCAGRLPYGYYGYGFLAWGLLALGIAMSGKGQVLSIFKLAWLFPYFLLGDICHDHYNKKKGNWTKKKKVTGFGMLFLAYIGLFIFFFDSEAYREFHDGFCLVPGHMAQYFLFYLSGCVGTAVIFMAAECFAGMRRYAAWIGYHSPDIYVQHMLWVKLYGIVSGSFGEMDRIRYHDVAALIYAMAVTMGITYLSGHFLYQSKAYRMSVGRRFI